MNFNPRTRVECDKRYRRLNRGLVYFNPRTRVECDWTKGFKINSKQYFNPRTRVECDSQSFAFLNPPNYFNPRTRVECDVLSMVPSCGLTYFNPRTRVECDAKLRSWKAHGVEFQSTHSCRVRLRTPHEKDEIYVFQSTHSCRVRLLILCGSYPISTLHKRNSEDILYIIQINNPFLARLTRLFMLNTGSLQ